MKKTAEVLSEYFDGLVSVLNLKEPENLLSYHKNIDDSIFATIRKFQNYPSTKSIRKKTKMINLPFLTSTLTALNMKYKIYTRTKQVKNQIFQQK